MDIFNTILTEAMQQAPSLCVLAWIVAKFIRADRDCAEGLRQLVDQHARLQQKTNDTIRENSVVLERLNATMQVRGR